MSDRIDHAAEARKHIDWAHDTQEIEGATDRTVTDNALIANAEATLALVEQQRIANLIALDKEREQYWVEPDDEIGEDGYWSTRLRADIREGLGL